MPSPPNDALPNAATAAPSPELADFREALTARLAPADAVEEHWDGEIAFALWQQQRLRALAAAAINVAESCTDEPDASRLPSLTTLARYRGRIERDLRLARQELEASRQGRPRLPADPHLADPSLLRWLADRIEAGLRTPPPANDTGEPEPAPAADAGTREPERHARAEPGPAAAPVPGRRPLDRHERRRLEALSRKAPEPARTGSPPAHAAEAVARR